MERSADTRTADPSVADTPGAETGAADTRLRRDGVAGWIDRRLPLIALFEREFVSYRVPDNLNWLWQVGGWILVALALLVTTGGFLALAYAPDPATAFASVQAIGRAMRFGWLIRSLHQAGASVLFACLWLHLWKSLHYGSFKRPRELVWLTGVGLLLAALGSAFLGALLPWGQTSYWAAVIAEHAVGSVPVVGGGLARVLVGASGAGGGGIGGAIAGELGAAVLRRAFVLHMLLGVAMLGLVALHVASLHVVGPNNPTGRRLPPERHVRFHPVHTGHAVLPLIALLVAFAVLVFFLPGWVSDRVNQVAADPSVTPPAIEPAWYLLPFYAVLRAVPGASGVLLASLMVPILLALPWLDRSDALVSRGRRWMTGRDAILALSFVVLVVAGAEQDRGAWLWLARLSCAAWFAGLTAVPALVSRAERRAG